MCSKSQRQEINNRHINYSRADVLHGSPGKLPCEGGVMEVLTAKEVADKLKLSVKTIHKLTRTGDIPHRQIGGAYRYKDSEILDWFDNLPQN